jgi:hypothetical protein
MLAPAHGGSVQVEPTRMANQTFVLCPPRVGWIEGVADVGALIMLGTLFGLIVLVFGVVLRYDPEARRPSSGEGGE